jgi:hypothetical protein
MTEFQKDLEYVKYTIKSSKTITEVMMSKSIMDLFFNKYWIHISPLDPVFTKIRVDVTKLYEEKFRKLTNANLTM